MRWEALTENYVKNCIWRLYSLYSTEQQNYRHIIFNNIYNSKIQFLRLLDSFNQKVQWKSIARKKKLFRFNNKIFIVLFDQSINWIYVFFVTNFQLNLNFFYTKEVVNFYQLKKGTTTKLSFRWPKFHGINKSSYPYLALYRV